MQYRSPKKRKGTVVLPRVHSSAYLFVFLVIETSLEHAVDDVFQALINVSVSSAIGLKLLHLQFGVFVNAVS